MRERTQRLITAAIAVFWLPVLLHVRVAAAAPWSIDHTEQERALSDFQTFAGGEWIIGRADDNLVILLTGKAPNLAPLPLAQKTEGILREAAKLRGLQPANFETLPEVRDVGESVHFTYQQMYGDRPVENAFITIEVDKVTGELDVLVNAIPPNVPIPTVVKEVPDVASIARKALEADLTEERGLFGDKSFLEEARERYQILPPSTAAVLPGPLLLSYDRELWTVYRVSVRQTAQSGSGPPYLVAWRDYDIDASSDSVDPADAVVRVSLRLRNLTDGKGRVFHPSPANALNTTVPKNQIKKESPPYRNDQLLRELHHNEGELFFLKGELAAIVNREGPPVEISSQTHDFSGYAGDERFASVMGYFHVDAMQRYVQELGFGNQRTVPLDIDANIGPGLGTSVPGTTDRRPYLGFGLNRITFVAEDGDVIAHEYAHDVLRNGGNDRFSVGSTKKIPTQAAAMDEGLADYWAMSTFAEATLASGHPLHCFGEWATDKECYRSLTDKKSLKELVPGKDRENSKIWSAVLFRIFMTLNCDRKLIDKIVLQGHFDGAKVEQVPTMKGVANSIVNADRKVHKKQLCAVLKSFDFRDIPACKGE